eukprot:SAG31_NODE_8477_length_1444_cov_1.182156_1_plen_321_part_01
MADALVECPKTCGLCASLTTDNSESHPFSLIIGHSTPWELQPGKEAWFKFTANATATYTITVTLVDLGDSELRLYNVDSGSKTVLQYNDDANTGLGSEIVWTNKATKAVDMLAEVQSIRSTDCGVFIIEVKQTDQATTCTDGVQDHGETGVDCGGPNCAACRIPLLFELNSSQDLQNLSSSPAPADGTCNGGDNTGEKLLQRVSSDIQTSLTDRFGFKLTVVPKAFVSSVGRCSLTGSGPFAPWRAKHDLVLAVVVEVPKSPLMVSMLCTPDCQGFQAQVNVSATDGLIPWVNSATGGSFCTQQKKCQPCYNGRCKLEGSQ